MIRWGWRLNNCGTGPKTGEAKAGRLGQAKGRAFFLDRILKQTTWSRTLTGQGFQREWLPATTT